jgi:hypothetical protein
MKIPINAFEVLYLKVQQSASRTPFPFLASLKPWRKSIFELRSINANNPDLPVQPALRSDSFTSHASLAFMNPK